MSRADLIHHAAGDTPASLLLENARLVDLLSGEIRQTHVALAGSHVVGFGGYPAERTLDLEGAYLAPGFIDAHVHVESSMVPPAELARAVLPRGVTTVITDPHEIANVLGLPGVRFMLDNAARAPFSLFVMAPSCVPATHMESAGAELTASELAGLRDEPRVLGLAEVMNFPGVVGADPAVLAKLDAFAGRVIDGHCPGLSGRALAAYAAAGIGSDHESTSVEEAREKLALGLTVFLREATNARNLRDLLPLVTPLNHHRLCFCTDDRTPADLLDEGSIDFMVRTAIEHGIDPIVALSMASLNPANYFRLHERGAVAPGRRADLVVFRDLAAPRPHLVFWGGRLVARDGEMVVASGVTADDRAVRNTVRVAWEGLDLAIPARRGAVRVIGAIPDQLVTEHRLLEPKVVDGQAVADPERDLLKIAVIERHRASGTVGKGFVQGMGLARGALASSVAHDHHNLVVVGADDVSMLTAARRAAELGGGMVAADGEEVLAELALPLAGLMSDQPIEEARRQLDGALAAARELGSPLHDPFMALSFLALEVIPQLKITDLGLVDVERFQPVSLWAEDAA